MDGLLSRQYLSGRVENLFFLLDGAVGCSIMDLMCTDPN